MRICTVETKSQVLPVLPVLLSALTPDLFGDLLTVRQYYDQDDQPITKDNKVTKGSIVEEGAWDSFQVLIKI